MLSLLPCFGSRVKQLVFKTYTLFILARIFLRKPAAYLYYTLVAEWLRVFDLKSLPPHCYGFESHQELQILSCEEAIPAILRNVGA